MKPASPSPDAYENFQAISVTNSSYLSGRTSMLRKHVEKDALPPPNPVVVFFASSPAEVRLFEFSPNDLESFFWDPDFNGTFCSLSVCPAGFLGTLLLLTANSSRCGPPQVIPPPSRTFNFRVSSPCKFLYVFLQSVIHRSLYVDLPR